MLWLDRLQEAVDGCGAFVLVGRVRRWIGAETQAALNRYFAPHDDAERLPIFPILLDGIGPEALPAFLRLFQMTPWNGADVLPEHLLADIRERKVVNEAIPFEGCPLSASPPTASTRRNLLRPTEGGAGARLLFRRPPGQSCCALVGDQRQFPLGEVIVDAGCRPVCCR